MSIGMIQSSPWFNFVLGILYTNSRLQIFTIYIKNTFEIIYRKIKQYKKHLENEFIG